MVEMPLKTEKDDEEKKINDDVFLYDDEGDIKKGESISEKEDASSGSGSGSGSDSRNNEDLIQDFSPGSNDRSPTRPKNLDMQTISVDSKGLEEFSKKANIDEI